MFANCTYAGAISSGADASLAEKLRLFGEYLGIAFQIKDDILDVVKTTEELGKTAMRYFAEKINFENKKANRSMYADNGENEEGFFRGCLLFVFHLLKDEGYGQQPLDYDLFHGGAGTLLCPLFLHGESSPFRGRCLGGIGL